MVQVVCLLRDAVRHTGAVMAVSCQRCTMQQEEPVTARLPFYGEI